MNAWTELSLPPAPDDVVQRLQPPWERDDGDPGSQPTDIDLAAPDRQRGRAVAPTDFWAHLPSGTFIYEPTRENWPASSVNSVILKIDGQRASDWLARNRPVHQMTWAPGLPMIIQDRLVDQGGWIAHPGAAAFNLYRGPTIKHGDADAAGLWVNHVRRVYPDEAEHLFDWFAHRVQRPDVKCNHAIVLGGNQGVGKDTILEPVKAAIGPWNFEDIGPSAAMGRFNGFLKSVILRISEARDLGDHDRFSFYDRTKTWIAAPPDVHRIDEKNRREYAAFNVCGVIVTTNRKDGLYIEPDDRRHFVAWSRAEKEDFTPDYWTRLYQWFCNGGNEAVAAWLAQRDLSSFDPKAPPPKTPSFWEVVRAAMSPDSLEMSDALETLRWPDAVTIPQVKAAASPDFASWMGDRKNSRAMPHRFTECGYEPQANPDSRCGRHMIGGERLMVYVRKHLDSRQRHNALRALIQGVRP